MKRFECECGDESCAAGIDYESDGVFILLNSNSRGEEDAPLISPATARELAAELVRLADEIDKEPTNGK